MHSQEFNWGGSVSNLINNFAGNKKPKLPSVHPQQLGFSERINTEANFREALSIRYEST